MAYKEDNLSDKDYYDLPENVNNKGFLYEKFVYEKLKKNKLVPVGFTPAGADNNAPDCKFLWNNKPQNLEIKLDSKADYGQSGLKYKSKKWFLDGKNTKQDKTMRDSLSKLGVEKYVNSSKGWGGKGVPRLFEESTAKKKTTWEDKEFDYAQFPDKYISIGSNVLSQFYNSKNIYYIHIGGLGTYFIGRDPAGISKMTEMRKFDGTLKLRIRKKGSSSNPNYRFSTALMVDKKPTPSAFDITDDSSIEFLLFNNNIK